MDLDDDEQGDKIKATKQVMVEGEAKDKVAHDKDNEYNESAISERDQDIDSPCDAQ